jgi:hypothetical protein
MYIYLFNSLRATSYSWDSHLIGTKHFGPNVSQLTTIHCIYNVSDEKVEMTVGFHKKLLAQGRSVVAGRMEVKREHQRYATDLVDLFRLLIHR